MEGCRTPHPFLLLMLLTGLLLSSPGLRAADLSLGVAVGTLGVGAEMGWRLSDRLVVRGAAQGLNWDIDYESSRALYGGTLRLRSAGAMLDWQPFGGRLVATAGALVNRTEVSGQGVARGSMRMANGRSLDLAEATELTASASFGRFASYLGMGWRLGPGHRSGGIGFSIDLGILFQDSPRVSLSASPAGDLLVENPALAALLLESPGVREALRREEQELTDELKRYRLFPVVATRLYYRF
ncbi:MAG: hypothetical protein JJT85_11525 [Chromatiales bacterium]|nr:hypothetical protein [Chromatiales bacterium]